MNFETNMNGMKRIWQAYKPAISFVFTFLLIYGGSTLLYSFYLSQVHNEVDYFTATTGKQAKDMLNYFGHNASLKMLPDVNAVTIYLDARPTVQVIEGCNGFAVLLLFIAFLFAFKAKWFHYLWFIPISLPLLWTGNVFRIYWLATAIAENGREAFAWQKSAFTTSIYFVILLIWMFWIRLSTTKLAK